MRRITLNTGVLLSMLLVLFSSCKKEYGSIEELDEKNIQAYLDANSQVQFNGHTDGYYYTILEPGTGAEIKNSDSIFYSFAFKSLFGKVYNETHYLRVPGTYLGYSDVFIIAGTGYLFKPVREVYSLLKRGGKAQLILPSRMAFGKNGLSSAGIGPNETLLVELGISPYTKKHELDEAMMTQFIADNNLTFTTDPSRIRYNITTPGTGTEQIGDFSTITCNYTGRYLDGTVFDSGTEASLRIDQLIKGWQLILPGNISEGGKIRMLIPSDLAYGNEVLDFDIEITGVTND